MAKHPHRAIATTLLLLLVAYIPETIAAPPPQQRITTCFASSPSLRRSAPSSRLQSSRLESSVQADNRRSVLRRALRASGALLTVAQSSPSRAEAKPHHEGGKRAASNTAATNASSPRSAMNFPRVHPGLRVGDPSTDVLCEVFVDFACPYSRKLFTTLTTGSEAVLDTYGGRMAFTFHNVLQPWHHQSLWLHESSFAIKLLYPRSELAYWKALFADAPNWYDKEIYGLTRAEFYDKIAAFAAGVVVADAEESDGTLDEGEVKAKILQYLIPPLQPGGNFPPEATKALGSGPNDDENAVFPLTRQVVKFQRKRAVHVTPTVFFNGIEQGQISSSWTVEEWTEFLDRALWA
eukprot:CAMPEP_0183315582 /NCGR_PEP_ID=MMETSP0160_2-20130417/52292_1 /TAXON_ID=2839 ORGANISM="Odontella Sinensis, Strain Grunow 1884" /NCGR_SAMPLE_ID=MMETSP0160_2 /ASSEMBLY_ACC=CAM_ASM_000250 /LENGTH=349 /DNA_ID=CAMNT_0025481183 /DNA_START=43 /DNA_END=1092 /DNA_ORIENTATION=-